jgi:hypothetical protein
MDTRQGGDVAVILPDGRQVPLCGRAAVIAAWLAQEQGQIPAEYGGLWFTWGGAGQPVKPHMERHFAPLT